MKLIRFQTQDREFNGRPFTYFQLFFNDNGKRVVVGCPGSTPCVFVDENGLYLSDVFRLDQTTIEASDEMEIWFDNNSNRVAQIDIRKK